LNGLATPGGLEASARFERGPTTNYGNVTTAQPVSAITRTASRSQTLAGLAAGVYQFRAAGSNGLHFSFGQNQSCTLLNGAPRLSIAMLAGNGVRLLWPTNPSGSGLLTRFGSKLRTWKRRGPNRPRSVSETCSVRNKFQADPRRCRATDSPLRQES
jgi:hypothetical protein